MAPEPNALATITSWLVRWREGDGDALSQVTTLVYAELHRLAAIFLSNERPGHTLQPTALVHELYVRLGDVQGFDWEVPRSVSGRCVGHHAPHSGRQCA